MQETHGRLVAIMFVRISDSVDNDRADSIASILSVEDIEVLCTHVKSFHGVVVDVRAGELFAHFPGAVTAFSAAASLLQILPEYSLRIGLHLGEIPFRKGRFEGVDVNLASRLPGYTGAGGICVSQNVYQYLQVSHQQQLIALGPRQLKNIQAVIPIYASIPADFSRRGRMLKCVYWFMQKFRKYHRYLLIFCVAAASGFTTGSHHDGLSFSEQRITHIYLPGFQQRELNRLQTRYAGSIEMTIRSRLAALDEIHLTSTRSNALVELLLMQDRYAEKLRISYVLNKLPQGMTIESGMLEAEEQQLFSLQDRLSDQILTALFQHKIIHSPVASSPIRIKLEDL